MHIQNHPEGRTTKFIRQIARFKLRSLDTDLKTESNKTVIKGINISADRGYYMLWITLLKDI